MSVQKIPVAGFSFITPEFADTFIPVTGSGTPSPSNGILTYTTTGAHGMSAGMSVTFTGATPSGYNSTTFVVLSVPSTTTFTIATTLGAISVAGSAVPVLFPSAGFHYFSTDANCVVQYNPDNTGYTDPGDIAASTNLTTPPTATVNAPVPQSATGATWRTAIPVSSQGLIWTDGYCVRALFSGSAGTTHHSKVK